MDIMEIIIQVIVLILGIISIGSDIADHGKLRKRQSNTDHGIVAAFITAILVAVIIFWNPTELLDVIAWVTTIGLVTWGIIATILNTITDKPSNPRPVVTTTRTLISITMNAVLVAAATTGILT